MVLLMKELLMQSTTVTKFLEKVTTFLMEYPQKELPDPPPGKPRIFCFVHDAASLIHQSSEVLPLPPGGLQQTALPHIQAPKHQ